MSHIINQQHAASRSLMHPPQRGMTGNLMPPPSRPASQQMHSSSQQAPPGLTPIVPPHLQVPPNNRPIPSNPLAVPVSAPVYPPAPLRANAPMGPGGYNIHQANGHDDSSRPRFDPQSRPDAYPDHGTNNAGHPHSRVDSHPDPRADHTGNHHNPHAQAEAYADHQTDNPGPRHNPRSPANADHRINHAGQLFPIVGEDGHLTNPYRTEEDGPDSPPGLPTNPLLLPDSQAIFYGGSPDGPPEHPLVPTMLTNIDHESLQAIFGLPEEKIQVAKRILAMTEANIMGAIVYGLVANHPIPPNDAPDPAGDRVITNNTVDPAPPSVANVPTDIRHFLYSDYIKDEIRDFIRRKMPESRIIAYRCPPDGEGTAEIGSVFLSTQIGLLGAFSLKAPLIPHQAYIHIPMNAISKPRHDQMNSPGSERK
ncbi:uncharacterized protein PGTG_18201 [Puccinia graminis f. sp. tritici CRL 75-36-700-3]|uniref:Uncharacterized protein n=1 Tax=Puccinia graminis f. sp. tritici (strain CRL 75-36-700-3 / race SCCL) TaxID=418459 RepID=E3L811_PUCGT|nr:uncharacterized protein PGTG_18201 [Puccinia graminis f. sp. tritici CRL 75-36-700-3]EFP92686.1 hypothetical protein PGTG_18201 [Puccinia graminis f. sp. tritici CRL 75-36-700-3]